VNPFVWVRAEILRAAWRRRLYLPPDRRILEHDILLPLARDPDVRRLLFVGVQWYTAHYPGFFAGKTFATIDPDPAVARWGGTPHSVGRIQELEEHLPRLVFDAIVITGVIGYGLNDLAAVNGALRACARALRPGGWLVLGVDELIPTHVDPSKSEVSQQFETMAFGGFSTGRIDVALPFKERRKTFLFWRRKGAIEDAR